MQKWFFIILLSVANYLVADTDKEFHLFFNAVDQVKYKDINSVLISSIEKQKENHILLIRGFANNIVVYIKYPNQQERDKAYDLFSSKTLKEITLKNFIPPVQYDFPSQNVQTVIHTPGALEKSSCKSV